MRQKPQEVHIDVKDLIRIGDQQMRNPAFETGALLLGKMEGTAFKIKDCVGLGLGDEPETTKFSVADQTRTNIQDELKLNPTSTWSLAHTHGPNIVGGENPSSADIGYAGLLENNVDAYGVSLVVKVNPNGGGFFTFFDGFGNEIPWVVTGLDGREYAQKHVKENGWGTAWNRDSHGLYQSQHFIRERPSSNNLLAA